MRANLHDMGDTNRTWRVTSALVTLVGGITFSGFAAAQDMDGLAVALCFASVAGFVGMLASPMVTTAIIAAAWSIALALVGQFLWATVMAVYGLAVAIGWRRHQTEVGRPELTLVHSS